MAFTVTKDTIIGDIMDADENTAPYFMEMGMHCLFCPASRGETLEEACAVHGVPVEEMPESSTSILQNKRLNYFRRPAAFSGASGDFFSWRKALDKRLVTCAKLCTGDFVCDVGTDHGYLPCFMIKENMCKGACLICCNLNAAKVGWRSISTVRGAQTALKLCLQTA